MADISAIFGTLLTLGIAFPGLLAAVWLLFPAVVERARLRLARTPWQCFWLGVALTLTLAVPVTILIVLPFAPAKFLGWIGLIVALALSSLGASGVAAHMGAHLAERSPALSPAGAFVRGAVALELAAFFPVIGWLVVVPAVVVTSVGATAFALLRWGPRAVPAIPEPLASRGLQNDTLAS